MSSNDYIDQFLDLTNSLPREIIRNFKLLEELDEKYKSNYSFTKTLTKKLLN